MGGTCIMHEQWVSPKEVALCKLLVGKFPVGRPKMCSKIAWRCHWRTWKFLSKLGKDLLPIRSDGEVRSQEESWLLKIIMLLRPHANEPKENPELQVKFRHTKPVNCRCGHHHWSMDEQHLLDYSLFWVHANECVYVTRVSAYKHNKHHLP